MTDHPLSSAQTPWQWAIQRATLIADILTSEDFTQLLVQGIDVIAETGQLVSDRPLQVETDSRQLTTRAVLLATGSLPRLPAIPGLETVPYETAEAFLRRESLPESVAIVGSTPLALMLCQILCRGQIPVSLITPNASLLNQEDPDVSRWMTAQLRAEGAQLRLATQVAAITQIDSGVSLNLPDATITAETVIIAVSPAPNLTAIQLEKDWSGDRSLLVNPYLQTQHPRIYACGSVLGSEGMPAIARQEARLAVNNALFWNRQRIDYCALPYGLLTQPAMARVGLTELQAKHRYQEDELLIHRQSLYENPKAQWSASTIGFCKLIAHRNGQLLGCHGVGPEASEWVQTISLLMGQKTPWYAISRYPTIPHSLSDLLRQTAQQWEHDRWQPGKWRRDWAENWFNWRRSR
ncbi:MAG: NAD(P)/FAD-dependent oxidoreductase [Leptolyngbya sp. SIO1D8]|nr:NAD(P)/FAD-dependent oxidoreductase [Leptolyngbya sp. SIO1D8]